MFPKPKTDLYRHLIIGIVLVASCLVLVGAMMQSTVMSHTDSTREDSNREDSSHMAPELGVPTCKDLGARQADYRGCTLLVDETDRQIIARLYADEHPMRVTHDVYLYGGGWGPNSCYFSGPIGSGPYVVYQVPCDPPPMRWIAP